LKGELEKALKECDNSPKIDRKSLEDLLTRKMFVIPSFEVDIIVILFENNLIRERYTGVLEGFLTSDLLDVL
jgi:hypothetical protein